MFQILMTSLYSYLHELTINNIFVGRRAYWATKASEARQGAKSATTRRIERSEIGAEKRGNGARIEQRRRAKLGKARKARHAAYWAKRNRRGGKGGTARVLSNEDERSSARREKRDDAAYWAKRNRRGESKKKPHKAAFRSRNLKVNSHQQWRPG